MHACMHASTVPAMHACIHVHHVIPERGECETRGKSEKGWMENGENEKGEGREKGDRKRGEEVRGNREDVCVADIRHPIWLQG